MERLRKAFLQDDRLPDAVLVAVLAYAGLRPEEALALQWRHIRDRTLLVEQKNVDGTIVGGQKTARPPRSIDLLGPLRKDILELRVSLGSPAADAHLPHRGGPPLARIRLAQLAPPSVHIPSVLVRRGPASL